MPWYYNHNSAFGDSGPFEADSKETLANEMEDLFYIWAKEKNKTQGEIRNAFIAGLELTDENGNSI
jgi:hypothetical protein